MNLSGLLEKKEIETPSLTEVWHVLNKIGIKIEIVQCWHETIP